MKYLFTAFCLAAFTQIHGQMGLKYGVVGGLTRAKSFKGFTEVYNEKNTSSLTKSLDAPSAVYGMGLELDYYFGTLYASAGMTWLFGEAEAKFQNDAKRHFDVNQNHFHGVIGFGNKFEDFEYAVTGGFSLRRSFIHTYIQYPNGDRDYNSGILNGTYTSVGIGIPLMAHVAKRLSGSNWVFAQAHIQFIGVYNFSYFRGTSTSLTSSAFDYFGYMVNEDNKNLLLEFGIKHNF
jgi:hypothetical protein